MAQRLRLSPPRTHWLAPFPWETARRTRPNYPFSVTASARRNHDNHVHLANAPSSPDQNPLIARWSSASGPSLPTRQLSGGLSRVDARRSPRFSTNWTPLLASSLAGSLVSAHTNCVGTSWPLVSTQTSRTPRLALLAHSPPCIPGPLASMPVHWLSRVSTCIAFRIARSARLLLLCGASSAVCVAGSFFPGRQLTRLTVLRARKPSGAVAHIFTPAMYMSTVCSMYITRSRLPTSSAWV